MLGPDVGMTGALRLLLGQMEYPHRVLAEAIERLGIYWPHRSSLISGGRRSRMTPDASASGGVRLAGLAHARSYQSLEVPIPGYGSILLRPEARPPATAARPEDGCCGSRVILPLPRHEPSGGWPLRFGAEPAPCRVCGRCRPPSMPFCRPRGGRQARPRMLAVGCGVSVCKPPPTAAVPGACSTSTRATGVGRPRAFGLPRQRI